VASDEGDTEILVGIPGSEVEIAAHKIVEDLHLGTWVDIMVFALQVDEHGFHA
jgi:hypothetical protein